MTSLPPTMKDRNQNQGRSTKKVKVKANKREREKKDNGKRHKTAPAVTHHRYSRSRTHRQIQKDRIRAPRQKVLTHSSMFLIKKQPSRGSSSEGLGSPTLLLSPTSGRPLQDGLYTDDDFPVHDMPINGDVVWKRPKEICRFPLFISDDATRMDICQGDLNDCWFLATVASLSLYPDLLNRVVPRGQGFHEGYNGRFIFRFWQYDEWIEVPVDDRLPTKDNKLIYLSSSDKNEFWSALLEKAYAKLKGGYTALNLGFAREAMADMTGGVTEIFQVPPDTETLSCILRPLLRRGALISCVNSRGIMGQKNTFQIVFMHVYSVTGLETIKTIENDLVQLIRVRNPWGQTEWRGPWSDNSRKEWDTVSREEQERVQRIEKEDGEFWMSLADFCLNFDLMEVCHLSEETLSDSNVKKPWKCTLHQGQWFPLQRPPQYSLTLLEEDDDPSDLEVKCSFLLALTQKHARRNGTLSAALHIYKARCENDVLSSLDLAEMKPVCSTIQREPYSYVRQRELVLRGHLPPGRYIIVPDTSETRETGEFLLRVLTEKGDTTLYVEGTGRGEVSNSITPPLSPRLAGLPSLNVATDLFMKHSVKGAFCTPLDLYNVLTEAIAIGVFAGSEKQLSLEHCKSLVVLMDNRGMGRLNRIEFQALWGKLLKWTGIFMTFDKNKDQALDHLEIPPALTAAGIQVDDFIMQLIGLRYTEPDLTVSFPGFLLLLTKLDTMIRKFQGFDMAGRGSVSVSFRQFLHITMYN